MSERFWDRQAKRFDTEPPTPEDDEAVRRAIPHLGPDDRVLEIGCAAGATAQALRPRVASWHGIDISPEMIRRAKRRAGDGLTFQQAGLDQVEPDGYSAVVAFNVLHFMDFPEALDRITDLLPGGGLLLAQTPCLGDVNRVSQGLARAFAKVMHIEGLQRLRFEDIETMVADRFDVVEADGARAGRTWIVARRR